MAETRRGLLQGIFSKIAEKVVSKKEESREERKKSFSKAPSIPAGLEKKRMSRRGFLGVLGATGIVATTGCSQLAEDLKKTAKRETKSLEDEMMGRDSSSSSTSSSSSSFPSSSSSSSYNDGDILSKKPVLDGMETFVNEQGMLETLMTRIDVGAPFETAKQFTIQEAKKLWKSNGVRVKNPQRVLNTILNLTQEQVQNAYILHLLEKFKGNLPEGCSTLEKCKEVSKEYISDKGINRFNQEAFSTLYTALEEVDKAKSLAITRGPYAGSAIKRMGQIPAFIRAFGKLVNPVSSAQTRQENPKYTHPLNGGIDSSGETSTVRNNCLSVRNAYIFCKLAEEMKLTFGLSRQERMAGLRELLKQLNSPIQTPEEKKASVAIIASDGGDIPLTYTNKKPCSVSIESLASGAYGSVVLANPNTKYPGISIENGVFTTLEKSPKTLTFEQLESAILARKPGEQYTVKFNDNQISIFEGRRKAYAEYLNSLGAFADFLSVEKTNIIYRERDPQVKSAAEDRATQVIRGGRKSFSK